MNSTDLTMNRNQVHTLLSARDPDVALLWLYLQCGNDLQEASQFLGLSEARCQRAGALLRQLGLWQDQRRGMFLAQEPPTYSEGDVMAAMSTSQEFPCLVGEVQRIMGRILTTEELKILLTCHNYLGLPTEVMSLLTSYCKERMRRRGVSRNPSLRSIQKEALVWAERGIDSLEEAVAYIQTQDLRQSQLGNLMQLLQISGRSLTPAEERYALSWIDMGFDRDALLLAYEKTCLNTGGLKWAYMDKILTTWHKQGFHTAAQVHAGDRNMPGVSGAATRTAVRQTQRVQAGSAGLGTFEREAIARMLREQEEEGG